MEKGATVSPLSPKRIVGTLARSALEITYKPCLTQEHHLLFSDSSGIRIDLLKLSLKANLSSSLCELLCLILCSYISVVTSHDLSD